MWARSASAGKRHVLATDVKAHGAHESARKLRLVAELMLKLSTGGHTRAVLAGSLLQPLVGDQWRQAARLPLTIHQAHDLLLVPWREGGILRKRIGG